MSEQPTQPFGSLAGAAGEPCPACGAALAPDQRYCLNCGERRGAPRVDFRAKLEPGASNGKLPGAAPTAPAPSAPKPPGEGEKPPRDYAPLAAAGGIAVLGIMLLIGVLIGRGTGSSDPVAPPQVVTVGAAESGGGGEAAGGDDAGAGEAKAGKGSGKKQGKKGDVVAGGSADTGSAPVASDDQLKQLEEQSPEEYQESSAKLPDEIATPGEAPPTDGKAPGGGSGGTTIE